MTDLTPDDNTLQFRAFLQTCSGATTGEADVQYELTYGTATLTGDFKANYSGAETQAVRNFLKEILKK